MRPMPCHGSGDSFLGGLVMTPPRQPARGLPPRNIAHPLAGTAELRGTRDRSTIRGRRIARARRGLVRREWRARDGQAWGGGAATRRMMASTAAQ